MESTYKRNIVYFCPGTNSPIGGVKVIHRHCQIINSFGASSEIYYHCGEPQSPSWFDHCAPMKADPVLSLTDYVILPEALIFHYWKDLHNLGIDFAIFVQNPYLINKGIKNDEIQECYECAKHIICISEDTVNCMHTFFPTLREKTIRVASSVNQDIFKISNKKNLITYMPRKMKDHSDLLITIASSLIPPGWEFLAIDGMSETEVASTLSNSSIFLAFSGDEGLALPPVEAAFSGNYVIGYTGNGGREYWNSPIFERIDVGDISKFISALLFRINDIDRNGFRLSEQHLSHLKNVFSIANEASMLRNMLEIINKE